MIHGFYIFIYLINRKALLLILVILFQALENNEEMKLRTKREASEEPRAPVEDKVCMYPGFLCNISEVVDSSINLNW